MQAECNRIRRRTIKLLGLSTCKENHSVLVLLRPVFHQCWMSLMCLSLQHALRFWLEQGVAGFAICDTDAAYSEKVKTDVFRCFVLWQADCLQPHVLLKSLHFRPCSSGEASSGSSAVRRTGIISTAMGRWFSTLWNVWLRNLCVALFRIVVVKQTRDFLSPLNNFTLIDVVLKSILPDSHHLLSAEEVSYAIETHLQTRGENIWPSWTVRASMQ